MNAETSRRAFPFLALALCAAVSDAGASQQWYKYSIVGNQSTALAQKQGKGRDFFAQDGEPKAGLTLYLDKKAQRQAKSRFESRSGSVMLVWLDEKGGSALDVPFCEKGVPVTSVALCFNVRLQAEPDKAPGTVPGANTAGQKVWHKRQFEGKDYYYTEEDVKKGGAVPLYTRPEDKADTLAPATLTKDGKNVWSFRPATGKPVALKTGPLASGKLSDAQVSQALADDASAGAATRRPEEVPGFQGAPVGGQDDKRDSFEKSIVPLFQGSSDKIAARLYGLIWDKRDAASFVSEEARKAQEDAEKGKALQAADMAAIETWVKRDPYRSAMLYYAIGPGKDDAWIKATPALAKLFAERAANPKFQGLENDLVACLGRWAGGETSQDKCSEAAAAENPLKKPLAGGAETRIPWVEAFLADASAEANKLLTPEVRKEIQDAINRIRSGSGAVEDGSVDGRGGATGRPPAAGVNLTKPFGVNELFGKWGDYNVLYVDGRKIAVVLRNSKPSDAAPNQINTEVGIYDITNESDIFGRRFSLDFRGSKEPFILDDRNPKGKRYSLEFIPSGNDKVISIKSGDGGKTEYSTEKPYDITLNGLFQRRAEQVKAAGNVVDVGGQKYYVSAESSDRGSLLFWSESTLGQLSSPNADPMRLQPSMMAYVNKKVGGVVTNIKEQVSLGKVGDKWYDLKWNGSVWTPVVGTEPKPETPPGGTGPGTTGPGSTGPGTTGPGTTPPGGGTYIGPDGWPVFASQTTEGPFSGPLNKALRADLYKDVVRFYDQKPPEGAQYSPLQTTLLWKANPKYQPTLPFMGSSAKSAPAVIGGKILRTDSPEGVLYIDVEKGLQQQGEGMIFSQVAAHRRGSQFQVPNKLILEDLLALIGYNTAKVQIVMKNVETQLTKRQAKAFNAATGLEDGKRVALTIGEHVDKIFPPPIVEDDKAGLSAPNSPEGVALDSSGRIAWTEFDDGYQPKDGPLEVAQGKTVEAKVAASHKTGNVYDAVVYEVKEGDKYHYYLTFSVKAKEYARQPKYPIDLRLSSDKPLFADGKGGARGVVLPEAPAAGGEGQFRIDVPESLLAGTNDYQVSSARAFYDAPSARKKNVKGVVVWWGMTEADAQKKAGYPEK